jgi:hypothetical protein
MPVRLRSLRDALLVGALFAGLTGPTPLLAWDDAGHRTVARIAWTHMTPQARAAAVAALKRGAPDMHFDLLTPSAGSAAARDRELFVAAATWPDLVRGGGEWHRYHQATWHYVERFWKQQDGQPTSVALPAEDPEEPYERITAFTEALRQRQGTPATPAMQLAGGHHSSGTSTNRCTVPRTRRRTRTATAGGTASRSAGPTSTPTGIRH